MYGTYTYGTVELQRYGNDGKFSCGKFCSIAKGVRVFLGGNHRTDWVTTYPFGHIHSDIFAFDGNGHPQTNGDVSIGNDVWIGAFATIMSGITIGDGAVVAANSHVVKNVEPYTIVGGNPARLIRTRFTPEQIEALLKIQWWNWDDTKINRHALYLCSPDISQFIASATE